MKQLLTSICLIGMCLSFVFAPLMLGKTMICCDNSLINLPAREFLFAELTNGRFPLWNPYVFSGTPFAADINLSPFYPGLYVEFLLSKIIEISYVFHFSIIIHLILAGVGMYWSVKKLTDSTLASCVSGCVYGLSGTLLTYANNIPMLQTAALFPWVFGAVIGYAKQANTKSLLVLILVGSLQVFAGYPQITFYSWIFLGMYYLICTTGNIPQRVFRLSLPIIGIIMMCAVQIVPFIEFARLSTRIQQTVVQANQGALPLTAVVRLLFPASTGWVTDGTDWWQGGSVYGFVGSIATVLVLCWSMMKNTFSFNRNRVYFLLIAGISLLLAFGQSTPLYGVIYTVIPGISLFRIPAHFLFLFTVSMSLLVGLMFSTESKFLRSKLLRWVCMLVGIVALFCMIFSQPFIQVIDMLSLPSRIDTKLQYLGFDGMVLLFNRVSFTVLYLSTAILILTVSKAKYLRLIMAIVIVIELVLVSKHAIVFIEQPPQIRYKKTEQTGRIFTHPSVIPSNMKRQFGEPWLDAEMRWQYEIGRPNVQIASGNRLVDGYASLVYRPFQQFFLPNVYEPTGVVLNGTIQEKLQQFSVNEIILPSSATCFGDCEQYESLPYIEQTEKYARRIFPGYPLARLENEAGIIELHSQSIPGKITVFVEKNMSGKVVYAETNYPGWQVYVDGMKQQLPSSIMLEQSISGNSIVEFRFEPFSVLIGGVISLVWICGVMVLIFYQILRQPQVIYTEYERDKRKKYNKH